MSGRFFRGGRQFVQAALQRSGRRSQHALTAQAKFSLTFTTPQAMQSALTAGAPIGSTNGGALGSATTGGVRAASTSASAGCGSASCCQLAVTTGEDGEEPFIGAPSLSSLNQPKSRGAASGIDANTSTGACATNTNCASAAAPSSSSSCSSSTPVAAVAPAPRVKCDPYEQGGHPLATDVVQMHMSATLDAGWSYDEEKKLLVRSFEFGRVYRGDGAGEDTRRLFAFVHDLGLHQSYGGQHPIYNLNLNLRANSLQVMLRTVPLRGISFQDLMLATKVDGMWFRFEQEKRAKDAKAARDAKAAAARAPPQ